MVWQDVSGLAHTLYKRFGEMVVLYRHIKHVEVEDLSDFDLECWRFFCSTVLFH